MNFEIGLQNTQETFIIATILNESKTYTCALPLTLFNLYLQSKSNIVTPRNGEPLIAAIQDFITGELLIFSWKCVRETEIKGRGHGIWPPHPLESTMAITHSQGIFLKIDCLSALYHCLYKPSTNEEKNILVVSHNDATLSEHSFYNQECADQTVGINSLSTHVLLAVMNKSYKIRFCRGSLWVSTRQG